MEAYFFRPEYYERYYNCNAYQVEQVPLEQRQHKLLGIGFMTIATIYQVKPLNSPTFYNFSLKGAIRALFGFHQQAHAPKPLLQNHVLHWRGGHAHCGGEWLVDRPVWLHGRRLLLVSTPELRVRRLCSW